MSEYLSKEEIKQWRSSLEKITLEEFAARLGKKIEETKTTNDLVDIVLQGKSVVSYEDNKKTRGERLSSIAERAMLREREISPTPFSIGRFKFSEEAEQEKQSKQSSAQEKTSKKAKAAAKKSTKITAADITKSSENSNSSDNLREEVRIIFKKALTDREQKVFDYFLQNSNKIVYAKDLAALLDLPRDYVYKYIKNLRAKIDGENLQNADKGGFILNV